MTLLGHLSALTTRIANYLRDSILPRLLPAGGTTGQALVKVNATDFNATWATISGGAGGTQQIFIQDTQPADTGSPYIWIQTGLANGGITIWYNQNGERNGTTKYAW